MLLNGTFLYCAMNAPNLGLAGCLLDLNLTYSATNPWIGGTLYTYIWCVT